jgi:hypothetical protein
LGNWEEEDGDRSKEGGGGWGQVKEEEDGDRSNIDARFCSYAWA